MFHRRYGAKAQPSDSLLIRNGIIVYKILLALEKENIRRWHEVCVNSFRAV